MAASSAERGIADADESGIENARERGRKRSPDANIQLGQGMSKKPKSIELRSDALEFLGLFS